MMATQETAHHKTVTVTLLLTDQDGNTDTREVEVPAGDTPVLDLKAELEVPESSVLWLDRKSGKKKALGDHETIDVKKNDVFEAVVRGGVS